jgi:hypothetical protein
MDPFSAIFLGLFAASGIIKGVGASKEAEANAKAAEYNAARAEENAHLVMSQTQADIDREALIGRKALGSIRAAYGASGVTMDGSPMAVMEESRAVVKQNLVNIQNKGILQAKAYADEAGMLKNQAGYTRESGDLTALGIGLGTGADIIRARYNMRRT